MYELLEIIQYNDYPSSSTAGVFLLLNFRVLREFCGSCNESGAYKFLIPSFLSHIGCIRVYRYKFSFYNKEKTIG